MMGGGKELATDRRTRRVVGAQNISRNCLVCGADNPFGLHASFYELEGEPGPDGVPGPAELLGIFTPRPEHQSYPGRLHGGVSSAILDETIGRAIIIDQPGTWGVTVQFTVKYRQPVPLEGEIRAVGRITRDTRRLFEGSGEIVLDDGTVAVEAAGKYIKMGIADIAEGFDEAEWFADPRPHPGEIDVPAPPG